MPAVLRLAETFVVGIASGLLSGMFGVGGGMVSTPAIRLLLGAPALVAVGTPLVAVLPSALSGASSYIRRGHIDLRSGLLLGAFGSVTAVLGAWLSRIVGGPVLLVATAVILAYSSADMIAQVLRPPAGAIANGGGELPAPRPPALVAVGLLTGLYSGLLGLGGGLVLVPMLTRWLRFPVKRAVGTSLAAMAVLSVPGIVTHALIGNVDWAIAAGLALGVVPGAAIGSRITLGASDRSVRISFAVLLLILALWLGVAEVTGVLV